MNLFSLAQRAESFFWKEPRRRSLISNYITQFHPAIFCSKLLSWCTYVRVSKHIAATNKCYQAIYLDFPAAINVIYSRPLSSTSAAAAQVAHTKIIGWLHQARSTLGAFCTSKKPHAPLATTAGVLNNQIKSRWNKHLTREITANSGTQLGKNDSFALMAHYISN